MVGIGESMVSQGKSYLFVDSSVRDYERLLSGVASDVKIVILNETEDGLAQMAKALEGQSNVGSIHILSHGANASLQLGSAAIDAAALQTRADVLADISDALTEDADILLYGCDVAASTTGKEFVEAIARLTAADVAASNDLTGKQGDWDLEFATGAIAAQPIFAADDLSAYDGNLAVFNIAAGDVAGLINAINAANAAPGADTINLAPGTYTLANVQQTALFYGDSGLPYITSDISIIGTGTPTNPTIIERGAGAPPFRILTVIRGGVGFPLAQGALTLDNVTIRNGYAQGVGGQIQSEGDGGGIYNSGGVVTIRRSRITGNTADDDGGGIINVGSSFNAAVMTISESEISFNQTNALRGFTLPFSGGGGIENDGNFLATEPLGGGGATLTITNTTISQNRASSDPSVGPGNLIAHTGVGGGINNRDGGVLTLNNVTLAFNVAEGDPVLSAVPGAPPPGAFLTVTGGGGGIANSPQVIVPGALPQFDLVFRPGTTTLNNTIVIGNTAVQGGIGNDIYSFDPLPFSISFPLPGGVRNFDPTPSILNSNGFNIVGNPTFFSPVDPDGIGPTPGQGPTGGPGLLGTDITGVAAAAVINPVLALNGNADNATLTHALIPGSPAINGSGPGATAFDQRKVPAFLVRDIGAYEIAGVPENFGCGNPPAANSPGVSTLPSLVFGQPGSLIRGTTSSDQMLGTAQNNSMTGFNGDDRMFGLGGNDSMDGGAGNECMDGGDGNDFMFGGALGQDTLNGGAGNDTMDGGSGDDIVAGDGGNDSLFGADGNDTLVGIYTLDPLLGSGEVDTLSGGNGADLYLLGGPGGQYYQGGGNADYALIIDFTIAASPTVKDTIRVSSSTGVVVGSVTLPQLGPQARAGLFADLDSSGTYTPGDDLIAVFQNLNPSAGPSILSQVVTI